MLGSMCIPARRKSMTLNRLQRQLKAARETLDAISELEAGAAVRHRRADFLRDLRDALECVDDLRNDVFVLQEQNQQLRRDLSQQVCPRLCATPHRCAT